jgi:hypothetical protein
MGLERLALLVRRPDQHLGQLVAVQKKKTPAPHA